MSARQLRGIATAESMSDGEIASQISCIETEVTVIVRRLGQLGEWVDGEGREVSIERDRLQARLNLLGSRYRELTAEQSRRLLAHVDRCAAERQLAADGGPRLVVGWDLGPPRRE